MAKLKLQIDGQQVEIDTNEFPEIASEVRSELEAEYASNLQKRLSEEKSNFYKTVVNPLKSENAQLKALAAQAPQAPNTAAEPQHTQSPAGSSNPATNPQTPAAATAQPSSDLAEQISKAIATSLTPIQSFIENQKQKEVAEIRQRVLSKYNGDIIEDLVKGETAEQIEESARIAHEAYKKVAGKFSAPGNADPNGGQTPPVNGQQPTPNPTQASPNNGGYQPAPNPIVQSPNTVSQMPAPQSAGNPPTMADFATANSQNPNSDVRLPNPSDFVTRNEPIDVRKMSDAEYEKHRENLLANAKPNLG